MNANINPPIEPGRLATPAPGRYSLHPLLKQQAVSLHIQMDFLDELTLLGGVHTRQENGELGAARRTDRANAHTATLCFLHIIRHPLTRAPIW